MSGGWNYRVIEREHANATTFTVHEVYYDDNGEINAWSAKPVAAQGEDSLSDLRADLRYMAEALAKPVLQYDALPQSRRDLLDGSS